MFNSSPNIVEKAVEEKEETHLYHVLKAEYDDKDKWKDLLTFFNNEANRKEKVSFINRFATMVSIQNQIREFALKNLHIEIENVKKDYDRDTKDRLAFLTEQAAIARKLDLQKNTMASQRFNTQNIFVANVRTDGPFYLNGYIAIEEEINLIENRKNKTPLNQTYFKAKMVKIATADFETNNKGNLYYALAIVLGGMIGIFYILIANASRKRKNTRVSS